MGHTPRQFQPFYNQTILPNLKSYMKHVTVPSISQCHKMNFLFIVKVRLKIKCRSRITTKLTEQVER